MGLAIFIGSSYFLLLTDTFSIQKIEVNGATDTAIEQEIVNKYLQSYLGANLIFFNSLGHEEKLLEDFKYLKRLDIYRVIPNKIVVKLETFALVANIIVEKPDGTIETFVINELGYIASEGITDENLPNIIMTVTDADSNLKVNEEIIDRESLEKILEAKNDFEDKFNLEIQRTYYLKPAKEVHLLTELGSYIWIDMTQEIDIQLAKLKKALTKLDIYDANIEYVDLRISGHDGEKVIYKMK